MMDHIPLEVGIPAIILAWAAYGVVRLRERKLEKESNGGHADQY